MMTLQDVFVEKLQKEKAHLISMVNQIEKFFASVKRKYWNPASAPFEIPGIWSDALNAAWADLHELEKYLLLDPELKAFTDHITGQLDAFVDRFWKWSKSKVLTTNEAAEQFGKSRSTIYRWIKQGKLDAKKVGRRWEIVA